MRCFLAIPLRPPALAVAQRVLAQLRDEIPAVRWARPETLHMTLHFFGAIDDGVLTAAVDAVRPAFRASHPFDVTIDRVGSFPERRAPRVLWLGASADNPPLLALATAVRERLRDAGFAVENRPFRAHATLGRPRDPWPDDARTAWNAARSRQFPPATFTADRAVLYESRTDREAAIYVERQLLPLGAV